MQLYIHGLRSLETACKTSCRRLSTAKTDNEPLVPDFLIRAWFACVWRAVLESFQSALQPYICYKNWMVIFDIFGSNEKVFLPLTLKGSFLNWSVSDGWWLWAWESGTGSSRKQRQDSLVCVQLFIWHGKLVSFNDAEQPDVYGGRKDLLIIDHGS